MVRLALLFGSVLAPLVSLLVYLDATRRTLPTGNRLQWSVAVGILSLVGFLIPSVFPLPLHRFALTILHDATVAVTPYEVILLDVGFGILVTAIAALGYLVGHRKQPAVRD